MGQNSSVIPLEGHLLDLPEGLDLAARGASFRSFVARLGTAFVVQLGPIKGTHLSPGLLSFAPHCGVAMTILAVRVRQLSPLLC